MSEEKCVKEWLNPNLMGQGGGNIEIVNLMGGIW